MATNPQDIEQMREQLQREYNALTDAAARMEFLERAAAALGVSTSQVLLFLQSARPLTERDLQPPEGE